MHFFDEKNWISFIFQFPIVRCCPPPPPSTQDAWCVTSWKSVSLPLFAAAARVCVCYETDSSGSNVTRCVSPPVWMTSPSNPESRIHPLPLSDCISTWEKCLRCVLHFLSVLLDKNPFALQVSSWVTKSVYNSQIESKLSRELATLSVRTDVKCIVIQQQVYGRTRYTVIKQPIREKSRFSFFGPIHWMCTCKQMGPAVVNASSHWMPARF